MPRRKTKQAPAPKPPREFANRPLADLKQLARKKEKATTPKTPPPEPPPSPPPQAEPLDDQALFLAAVQGIAPLAKPANRRLPDPEKTLAAQPADRDGEEVMQALRELVDGETGFSIHETDEAVEGSVEGLDPRILRKLRRGDYAVQDHLDLHRLTRDEARDQVERFLLKCLAEQKRCVLIIHGRGHGSKDHIPVLKQSLVAWFTRRALRKKILAFTTARLCDGGAGAVYVLLRKPRLPGPR